jgi:hypothetical protein
VLFWTSGQGFAFRSAVQRVGVLSKGRVQVEGWPSAKAVAPGRPDMIQSAAEVADITWSALCQLRA